MAEWVRTGEIATRRVRAALHLGRSVIVDDTSSPRFLRDRWRSLAAELDVAMVLVFVDVAVSTIRGRQVANRSSGRRPDVSDAVMDDHLAGFQRPGPDEAAVVVSEASVEARVVAAVVAELDRVRRGGP